jgi:protein-S-isoprenylcysteine O-methyltransferase Ste14
MNYITGINEIINIWSNDANIVISIFSIILSPLLVYLNYNNFRLRAKNLSTENTDLNFFKTLKLFNVEIFFSLCFLSFITGLVGIGQIIVDPLIDSLVKGAGTIIFFIGFLFRFLFLKKETDYENKIKKEAHGFYSLMRYPDYTLIWLLALGFSLLTINIAGLSIVFFMLLTSVILRIAKEEKAIIEKKPEYMNYKSDVPMLFPDLIKKIKHFIIMRSSEK